MAEALRQRKPRERNKDYLSFIAGLKCVLCGDRPECAHVRFSEACPNCEQWVGVSVQVGEEWVHSNNCPDCQGTTYRYGKRPTGAGEKPSDWWTLPLCPYHHRNGPDCQHNMNETEFWRRHKVDALWLCTRLQDVYNTSKSRADAIQSGLAVLENVR